MPTPAPPSGNEPPKPAGAPEAYTDFTAPDGTTLDKDAVAAALPMFKELGLSQEQAQKVVNAQAARDAAVSKAAADHYNTIREGWRSEVTKEYGNNLDGVRNTVGQALTTFDEPTRTAFSEAMNLTGVGDNPAFIKVVYGLAKQVVEGKPVAAPAPSAQHQPQGFSKSLYPNLP